MNCINHPQTPVASYCQNCGKALCSECTRPVGGFIYCEQCLAAKVGVPGAQPGAPFPPGVPIPSSGPNPALATILGIIPGVGAMYNGQFVKAMIHVLVFVILIAITDQHDFFGFFIAAWVLYQIFDANQTAKARRDGLPLPDPFGINELANRLGTNIRQLDRQELLLGRCLRAVPASWISSSASISSPPSSTTASFVGGAYPPPAGAGYTPPPPSTPYPPSPPFPDVPPPFPDAARRSEPVGAIVLIVLGLLFLFGTLGIFSFHWIGRGWPLIIIGIGVWLFFKQARRTLPPGWTMNTWLLIRRLRGPAFLLLVGVTALLNQWDVLSFSRSWPLYLILFGIMSLAERAALSQAQMDAFDPITGQPRTPDTTIYGAPGYGSSGTSIVPTSPSTAPGPDSGAGRS